MSGPGEQYEPSGSNDALFLQTMADLEQRDRWRMLTYRRRASAMIVAVSALATIFAIVIVSLLVP